MQHNKVLDRELIDRLRSILKDFPPFCKNFFLSISNTTAVRTRIGYAYDLRLFFDFLIENISGFEGLEIKGITPQHLNNITYQEIELFTDYISYHKRVRKIKNKKNNKDNKDSIKEQENQEVVIAYTNNASAKSRKLSSIRRLFAYLYKNNLISSNPAQLVDMPKVNTKNIVYLEPDEVIKLLNTIEYGEKLVDREEVYYSHNKVRDLAIITLLLGTGIRVSECVGININDIDLKKRAIQIIRKGGNEDIVYFGDEVYDALYNYLGERQEIKPLENNEDALFLSLQKKRIGVRTVQKLVKKYAQKVTTLKNISPHKLRSTYGTALYSKTEDIFLVAEALGHANINTTKKYYVKMSETRKRKAAEVTKLRDK